MLSSMYGLSQPGHTWVPGLEPVPRRSHSFRTILVVIFHGASHGPVRVDCPESVQHCPAHITLVVLFFLMISSFHPSCSQLVLLEAGVGSEGTTDCDPPRLCRMSRVPSPC